MSIYIYIYVDSRKEVDLGFRLAFYAAPLSFPTILSALCIAPLMIQLIQVILKDPFITLSSILVTSTY